MTLSEILKAAYEETGYGDNPSPTVSGRFTRWVNEGQRAILSEPGLSRLADSDAPLPVASVANTARVVVPEAVARIVAISERTNDLALRGMSLDTYRAIDPDAASNGGTPTHFVPIGRVALAAQPSDASTLLVDSTSALDTGVAYLTGIVSGGYQRRVSVSLTGTTAVAFPLTDWIEITEFVLAETASGTVTLVEDAEGGTELARIVPGSTRPRYYAFYLWPTPSAAVTYYVDYRREVEDLSAANDEPLLPTDFHPALVAYAVMRERQQKDETERYVLAKKQYDGWVSRLKYHTQTLSAEIPVQGRGALVGHSRLGSWFPADTWRR